MSLRGLLAYCGLIAVVIAVMAVIGLTTLHRIVAKVEASARAERDAHWTAEIEKSNAETERRLRLQAMAVQAADAVARDRIEAASLKISELEKKNEALPVNSCGGLGRDRVQLLDFGHR